MTEEEKKGLEDAAKAARETADQAHDAAAQADGADEALNKAAETAEEVAQDAQAAVDAAVVETPEPEAPAPEAPENGDTDIDFEKELEAIGGKPATKQGKPLTEAEKAERALFFNAKRFRELGGDPSKVLEKVAPIEAPAAPVAPAPVADPQYATKDDLAEAEASKYARSEAERKVIIHHYKHSIQRSGNIIADIENAYMIAHKGRITRSWDEIRRAGNSRPMQGAGPGRKPAAAPAKAPELQTSERAIMQRRGFKLQQDGSWESKRYRMHFDKDRKGWITTKKA